MYISIIDSASRLPAETASGAMQSEREGLHTYWVAGGWRDPLLLCALAGQQARSINFGSSIVSVFGTHPTVLAEQALTVNAALQGRFTLGVGVSHRQMVQGRLGGTFDRPVLQLREFLTILDALLSCGQVDFSGKVLSAHTELRIEGVLKPDVVVGALSEQSLRVAGRLADGIVTTWVEPAQLQSYTIPIVSAAAAEAGRPVPRIIAGMPVCVTTDAAARDRVAEDLKVYKDRYTAYAATFARSGVAGADEVAVIGDEMAIQRELRRFHEIGADEFVANLIGTPAEQARTRTFLSSVADAFR